MRFIYKKMIILLSTLRKCDKVDDDSLEHFGKALKRLVRFLLALNGFSVCQAGLAT